MKVGMVLAGGGAKGALQIGALKAIHELVSPQHVKCISCASVGVLNGYAFATNRLALAEEMWRDVCSANTRILLSKMLRSSMLQQSIKNIHERSDALQLDFYCTLLDFSNKKTVYKNLVSLNGDKILEYLKASVAVPLYNRAVQIDGVSYYDGGIVDNIPVYPLYRESLDYIICVYFDDISYTFEDTHYNNKIIKITFPSKKLLSQTVIFQRKDIDEMIDEGYERTYCRLKTFFAEGADNLEYIYRAIRCSDAGATGSELRVSADMMITNLNKLTHRFAKRRIEL